MLKLEEVVKGLTDQERTNWERTLNEWIEFDKPSIAGFYEEGALEPMMDDAFALGKEEVWKHLKDIRNKSLIIGTGVVVTGAVGYFIYKKKKKQKVDIEEIEEI